MYTIGLHLFIKMLQYSTEKMLDFPLNYNILNLAAQFQQNASKNAFPFIILALPTPKNNRQCREIFSTLSF